MERLRLASFPHLSYLPQFVAEATGAFARAGVEVRLAPFGGSWPALIEALTARQVDVIVGNIWFALRAAPGRELVLPVAGCLRQSRFLLYRRPPPAAAPFAWGDLRHAAVLIPTDVPTPWLAFREALRVHGVALDAVRAMVGYSTSEAASELARGGAEFAVLDIEHGLRGGFEELAPLADTLGPVPWSVYFAHRDDLVARPGAYHAFQQAIGTALWRIQSEPAATLAHLVAPWFPRLGLAERARIIDRYLALGAWPATIALDPGDVVRWQEVLIRWGALRGSQAGAPSLWGTNEASSGGGG